jgi:hypothetical protein
LGQYRAFGAAVPAKACPEIATSIIIDTAKARFFVIVLFPWLCENPRSSGNAQIFVAARYDLISAGENWVTAVASSGSFDRVGHAFA